LMNIVFIGFKAGFMFIMKNHFVSPFGLLCRSR
jgi:hypothetical protein